MGGMRRAVISGLLLAALHGSWGFPSVATAQVDGRSQLSERPTHERPIDVAHDPFARRIAEKLPRPVVKYAPGQLPGQSWVPGRRSILVVMVAIAMVSATVYLWPRID